MQWESTVSPVQNNEKGKKRAPVVPLQCVCRNSVDTAVPVDYLGRLSDLCGQAHVHLPAQAGQTLDPASEAGASTHTCCAPACALL